MNTNYHKLFTPIFTLFENTQQREYLIRGIRQKLRRDVQWTMENATRAIVPVREDIEYDKELYQYIYNNGIERIRALLAIYNKYLHSDQYRSMSVHPETSKISLPAAKQILNMLVHVYRYLGKQEKAEVLETDMENVIVTIVQVFHEVSAGQTTLQKLIELLIEYTAESDNSIKDDFINLLDTEVYNPEWNNAVLRVLDDSTHRSFNGRAIYQFVDHTFGYERAGGKYKMAYAYYIYNQLLIVVDKYYYIALFAQILSSIPAK